MTCPWYFLDVYSAFYFQGFPKCGTTDLYKRLLKHPSLLGGYMKEPHYLTRSMHVLYTDPSFRRTVDKFCTADYLKKGNKLTYLISISTSLSFEENRLVIDRTEAHDKEKRLGTY